MIKATLGNGHIEKRAKQYEMTKYFDHITIYIFLLLCKLFIK